MKIEQAQVAAQEVLTGGYRVLLLDAPSVAAKAMPGQFVHLLVPRLRGAVLRRPFSVFRADGGEISILYKCVGLGTEAMAGIRAGDRVDLLGPLGNGFPMNAQGTTPVLVAGGYGVAPLWFLAKHLAAAGIVFVGGATAEDVLCVEEFEALGWDVRVSTEDGSAGSHGLVTGILDEWLESRDETVAPEFYSCGPDGMLKEVGARAMDRDLRAWLSLDTHMGCGVGACLACVQRIRKNGQEQWGRVCKDGPVFESREIVWK
ncbi:MAG: dihydroorotate dehydrogenase electron transfer subunit [Lentisphaerae bacterium]|nr:dihydroorotate dehydrogenase electron transfer subunit [Lentisphaerota bacterium]